MDFRHKFMIKLRLTCTLFYSIVTLFGQTSGYVKKYNLDNINTVFHAIRNFNNDLIIVGQHGIDSSGLASIFILQIDTLGVIKSLNYYHDPTYTDDLLLSFYSYEAVANTTDKGVIFAGSMRSRNNTFLIKLDSTLGLEFFYEYPSNYNARYVNHILEFQGYYYVTGIIQTLNLDSDIFIEKIDSCGKLIWEKTFGTSSLWDNAQYSLVDSTGITVLASEWIDPNHSNLNDSKFWNKIFHIDTSGEIKWQMKTAENEEAGSPSTLIKASGKYYYLTRRSYQVSQIKIWYGGELICRDSLFELLWKKDYDDIYNDNGFSDMWMDADGYLYLTGQFYHDNLNASVFKINPLQGDTVWTVSDTGIFNLNWGSLNYMEGISGSANGSIYAIGSTYDLKNARYLGLIFKVTKDGCIDSICTTSTILEYENRNSVNINLYPNPASTFLNIDFEANDRNYLFELINTQGIVVFKSKIKSGQNKIDLSEIKIEDGFCFWFIKSLNGTLIKSGKVILLRN